MLSISVSINHSSFNTKALVDSSNSSLPNQDDIPEIFEVKQAATAAYSYWLEGHATYEHVQNTYLQAEKLCIAYGYEYLENMPMTGNFIPERYCLLGEPRKQSKKIEGTKKRLPAKSKDSAAA